MITFEGSYFDGNSSRAYPVTVTFDGTRLRIRGAGGHPQLDIPFDQCTIAPPLGRTSRSIRLPGGAQCETNDLGAISAIESETRRNFGMRLVHFLEGRWKMVALSFIGLVMCVWAFTIYGIPFLAKQAAYSIPPELSEELSMRTMKVLDDRFLKPSELGRKRTERLKRIFKKLHTEAGGDHAYQLAFRKSPLIGPNAFALPSGQIIMTDELVKLSRNNRELQGVLLHEIAHVKERHGMRMIIQNAGVFLLISSLVGDITSITTVAGSLPTLLAQSGYSRGFEREADRSAAVYFIHKGWSTKPYQDILARISKDMPNYPGESLMSSHPVTNERVKYIRDIEGSTVKK